MKNLKLYVYSKNDFDELMRQNHWFSNEDVSDDFALISICNTENSEYPEEDRTHWFKKSSDNILNVDFDDISETETNGKVISDEQAQQIVKFILNNYGNNFLIHCSAGKSRSQGIARFILDCSEEIAAYKKIENVNYNERADNPCMTPNWAVTAKLKRVLRFL